MFLLNESDVIEVVESFSKYVGAPIEREFARAALTFDNNKGKGEIKAYNIFPGLAAITYDIILRKDLELTVGETPLNPVYFVFCLEGHMEHRFSGRDYTQKIHFQQNVILSSSNKRTDFFIIPGNKRLKISFIYLFRDGITKGSETQAEYLRSSLSDIFEDIRDDEPYKYFGHILPKTADYVRMLISNNQGGVAGRLLTEASILNILASQLIDHEEEMLIPVLNTELNKRELEKVISLTQYIAKNISQNLKIEELKSISGLSPKKLQKGFKHLYGKSVHNYIRSARLEYARESIETTDMTISEIVYTIGISNRSNFSKNFKQRYGMLPKDYRNMIKPRIN